MVVIISFGRCVLGQEPLLKLPKFSRIPLSGLGLQAHAPFGGAVSTVRMLKSLVARRSMVSMFESCFHQYPECLIAIMGATIIVHIVSQADQLSLVVLLTHYCAPEIRCYRVPRIERNVPCDAQHDGTQHGHLARSTYCECAKPRHRLIGR